MLFLKKQRLVTALQSPLTLLVSLILIRGLIYLSIFPPFLAPDESAHFEAIRLIGQEGKWPMAEVYAVTPMHPAMVSTFEQFRIWTLVGLYSPTRNLGITDNLFIHYYPTQIAGSEVVADSYLMLYHLSLAPLAAILTSFDLAAQVYALRFMSVIMAAITVSLAWLTIRSIFPTQKIIALGACSFIVFWPMHSHVTASINADVLAELIASLFFLILAQTYHKGISLWRGAWLIVLLGLGLLTKPTAFFLFPTLIVALIIYLGRKLKWTNLTIGLLIGGLMLVAWASSLFLYENSGGGRKLLTIFSEGMRFPHWSNYITPNALAFYLKSLNFAVVSFGGLFGWSNIHVPWSWVQVWAILLFLIIVGVLVFVYQNLWGPGKKKNNLNSFQKDILVIFLLAILFSLIGVTAPIIVTQSPRWGIHSRYYFPAIIPIALYLFLGVRQLIPGRLHKVLWPGWLVGWVLYDATILFFILFPFLYS